MTANAILEDDWNKLPIQHVESIGRSKRVLSGATTPANWSDKLESGSKLGKWEQAAKNTLPFPNIAQLKNGKVKMAVYHKEK